MPEISHNPLLVAAIIAFLGLMIGLAKGGFNALGALLTPILSLVLPVSLAVGVLMPPRTFIATTALFFALVNWVKVPGFLYTGVLNVPLLLSFWWVFLFIPIGIGGARLLVMRLNQPMFEWLVIALLVLTSGLLFWQSR